MDDDIRVNWWQVIRWGLGSIVVFLVLWMAIASSIWGFRVATAGIYGSGEARIEIQSGSFRIEAYQSFFNQCGSIQGLEGQIDEQIELVNSLEEGSRAHNLALSALAGIKGLRHTAIANYNQDARKDWTVGQFRDEDLPYEIDDNDYPPEPGAVVPNGGKIVCAIR